MWNNPKIIGQCVMLIGSFVMEKLSNTRAIIFGGTELDAGSAAAGSVYMLDIHVSILINTVVCIIHVCNIIIVHYRYKFILIFLANQTLLAFGWMGLSKCQWLLLCMLVKIRCNF